MKTILFAGAALALVAAAPASAQMMMGNAPGTGMSCVSGGQFVPCPGAGGMMQPGMAQPGMMRPGMTMEEPRTERRMTRREMREQRRMMNQQPM